MSADDKLMSDAPVGLRPFQVGDDPRRGRGPMPGAPNAGRPPDVVRRACREAFADRVPMLADLADNGTPEVRLRALDMLGRYGLGTSFTFDGSDIATGVIVLPELQMRDVAAEVQRSLGLAPGRPTEPTELVYVVEELEPTPTMSRIPSPPQGEPSDPGDEETVDPEIVRKVLSQRAVRG